MRGLFLTGDYVSRAGYTLSGRELDGDHRALNGSAIWKNSTLAVRHDVPLPVVGPHDVLMKVKYCGVCGSDVHFYETDADGYILFPGHSKLPLVIGHEFSGEVVEVGSAVRRIQVGDMVTAEGMDWCGECAPCRAGYVNQCQNLEELGFTVNGAFADYVVAHSKYALKLNDIAEATGDVDAAYRAGALVEPAAVTYNAIVTAAGNIKPGQHVAVFGTGPIGCCAIQMLRAARAARIFAFEMSPERREMARQSGATDIYDPAELTRQGLTPSQVIADLTHGLGIGMGVEAAGANWFTVPEIERALSVAGKMVQIGLIAGATAVQLQTFQVKRAAIFGGIGSSGHENWANVIQLMAARRIDVLPIATGTFPLEHAIEAIEETAQRRGGKILVQVS